MYNCNLQIDHKYNGGVVYRFTICMTAEFESDFDPKALRIFNALRILYGARRPFQLSRYKNIYITHLSTPGTISDLSKSHTRFWNFWMCWKWYFEIIDVFVVSSACMFYDICVEFVCELKSTSLYRWAVTAASKGWS